MSVIDDPRTRSLIERVRLVLTRPKEAFQIIEGEPATTQGLYTAYACILAALPALAVLGVKLLFAGFLFNPAGALISAIMSYLFSLVMVFVLALIADALAPSIGGTKSQIQALKASVYGCTAGWIGGACLIVPVLGPLGWLAGAVYSLYLLYLGLPRLMKIPEDKAAGYVVVTILAAMVAGSVLAGILFPLGMGRYIYLY